ncbi:chemotaxis protein CheC [Alteribacillus persepolensis]|uniref:Chemotaxis protein CheC n=1 Tax=Alteribacillus persepolensis TaxID=568899 RepID=A0A1G7YQI0_9BACI|nr:chemotaxis protein CheC [Alteribacillus persepolensis]SDG98575.1 chemotaxis protein CheC [Alteribacillus persepolensis]
MEESHDLHPFQLDILQEAGNIGAAHAATSLSKLLDRKIQMDVPFVRTVMLQEMEALVGGAETCVAAAFMKISGDAPGRMFLVFQQDEAKELAAYLTGKSLDYPILLMDEMGVSSLQELANILAGAYLSAIADFTSIWMQPSPPLLAIDMAGALLSEGIAELFQSSDAALVIDTVLNTTKGSKDITVAGKVFFVPEPGTFATICQALGDGLL